MAANGDVPAGGADGAVDDGHPASEADTQFDIHALEAEKADLKDRLMRALADAENLRRRAERDVADARLYAVTGFARDMLTVADNIRRAIDSVPHEGRSSEIAKPLLEGIELTERDLLATLGRHKVRRLEPEGQKFDPNMHQAMFELPRDDIPNGTVVQVVQAGWAIGDRVLRPAMVGISKGVPAASSETSGGA